MYRQKEITEVHFWTAWGVADIQEIYLWSTKVRPTSILPRTYQEVEYIQSDWWAYINTWYTPNTSDYFWLKFKWAQVSNVKSNDYLYWANVGTNNNWLSFENTNWFYWNAWSTTVFWKHTVNIWTDFEYDIKYNNWTLSVSWTQNWSYSYSKWNWLWNSVFVFFANWTGVSSYMNAKLYYLKMYSWSWFDLIRDFVPCYRKSDNVIWLYDIVEWNFYTNSWGWTFTKGADVK